MNDDPEWNDDGIFRQDIWLDTFVWPRAYVVVGLPDRRLRAKVTWKFGGPGFGHREESTHKLVSKKSGWWWLSDSPRRLPMSEGLHRFTVTIKGFSGKCATAAHFER